MKVHGVTFRNGSEETSCGMEEGSGYENGTTLSCQELFYLLGLVGKTSKKILIPQKYLNHKITCKRCLKMQTKKGRRELAKYAIAKNPIHGKAKGRYAGTCGNQITCVYPKTDGATSRRALRSTKTCNYSIRNRNVEFKKIVLEVSRTLAKALERELA